MACYRRSDRDNERQGRRTFQNNAASERTKPDSPVRYADRLKYSPSGTNFPELRSGAPTQASRNASGCNLTFASD
jgi:hypothetical protein